MMYFPADHHDDLIISLSFFSLILRGYYVVGEFLSALFRKICAAIILKLSPEFDPYRKMKCFFCIHF